MYGFKVVDHKNDLVLQGSRVYAMEHLFHEISHFIMSGNPQNYVPITTNFIESSTCFQFVKCIQHKLNIAGTSIEMRNL